MDFEEMKQVHFQWIGRLRSLVQGAPVETLDPETAASDSACELGRWIYDDGKRYANFPEYAALREDHAKFHRCAAEVILAWRSGDVDRARSLLGVTSAFANASTAVISRINLLGRMVG
jgi:hypothetical protein